MPKYDRKQYSIAELYKFYKTTTDKPVTKKEYQAIMNLWGEKVVKYLVEGKDVRIYADLNKIGVRKKLQKTYVDLVTRKRIPNTHSNFYVASSYWGRRYAKCKTKGWSFKSTRYLARKISAVMKDPGGHRTYVKMNEIPTTENQAKKLRNTKIYGL